MNVIILLLYFNESDKIFINAPFKSNSTVNEIDLLRSNICSLAYFIDNCLFET